MKITPLDIRQQQFTVRFRGFDAEEVDTFLEMIADEYEELMRRNIPAQQSGNSFENFTDNLSRTS